MVPSKSVVSVFDGESDPKKPEAFKKIGPWCYTKSVIENDGKAYITLMSSNTLRENENKFDLKFFVADRLAGLGQSLRSKEKILIKLKASGKMTVRIDLISKDGTAYGKTIVLDHSSGNILSFQLSELEKGSMRLLPNAYPGFMNEVFPISAPQPFNLSETSSIQIHIETDFPVEPDKPIIGLAEILFQ